MIGPRDIKRGVHLLTNADMAILNIEEEEEPAADEEAAGASGALAKIKRKRRDSGVVRGEKLSEEQTTRVGRFAASRREFLLPLSMATELTLILFPVLQIHEQVAQEIDPDGAGLSYTDFVTIARVFPDFFTNMRMAV
jgi:hypothetical protein